MKPRTVIYALFASSPFIFIGLAVLSEYFPQIRDTFDEMPTWGAVLFIGFFLTAWITFIWDVWRNPRMPKAKRKLWTAVLFLANWYALPF